MKTPRWLPLVLLVSVVGCTGPIHGGGLFTQDNYVPPPEKPEPVEHAKVAKAEPAVKRTYRYYPAVGVYADPDRSLYYYPENKKWKTGNEIPEKFGLTDRKFVTLVIATEKPYLFYKQHRKKYPPPKKVVVKKPAPVAESATPAAASAAPATEAAATPAGATTPPPAPTAADTPAPAPAAAAPAAPTTP